MATTPTGATHEVPLEDMFFSTTDPRGLILQANEVFVRLARQSADQLLGAPHNIIRHPDMPGGAFRIIWSSLHDGEPVAAYVVNLAADGSAYWTFATVVPVEHGYLSVRSRPLCDTTRADVGQIYRDVREKEMSARDRGASAAGAAVVGNELILGALVERGYDSYGAFIHDALCAEVDARLAARGPLPRADGAIGVFRMVLDGVEDIELRLRDLFTQLGGFREAADSLFAQCQEVEVAIEEMAGALARLASEVGEVREEEPILARAVEPLHERATGVRETVAGLTDAAENLTLARATLRYSAGMALLQVEMMARFVVALIQEKEDSVSSAAGVSTLGDAVESGLATMERDLAANQSRADELQRALDDSGAKIRVMQMTVGRWREMAKNSALAHRFADDLADLDAQVERAQAAVASLGPAAAEFSRAGVAFTMGPTRGHLERVTSLLDDIARTG